MSQKTHIKVIIYPPTLFHHLNPNQKGTPALSGRGLVYIVALIDFTELLAWLLLRLKCNNKSQVSWFLKAGDKLNKTADFLLLQPTLLPWTVSFRISLPGASRKTSQITSDSLMNMEFWEMLFIISGWKDLAYSIPCLNKNKTLIA